MKKERKFLIQDINCETIIEIESRKEVLSWLNEYVENLLYDWFDGSNDSFSILYKDGTIDTINEDYDGHKIKKQNIESIVYTNACTDMVYGNFDINEYGVVTPAFKEKIADTNIIEIK